MQHAFHAVYGVLSDRRALFLAFTTVMIAFAACRGGGSNPSESQQGLPLVRATTSAAQCINHIQPEGAPTFDEIDRSRLEPLMDGLRYYDIEEGGGETPQLVDAVSVEYTGWLEDGCMFDTSYPNQGPVNFPLLNVIRGWQQGFSTMQEGGTRVIEVSPSLAYGAIGFPPRIPPDATLIFHVNLVSKITIQEAQATVQAEIAEATAQAEDMRATIVAGGIPDDLPPSCQNSEQPEDAPAFGDIDFERLETLVEGVRYYDIEVGSGQSPELTDEISVEYTGWLTNGCLFDTSYVDEGPVTFSLNGVIEGWQEGLSTMQPGGVRVIEIAPGLAYGQRGSGNAVPPNATIIFYVELLGEAPAETGP